MRSKLSAALATEADASWPQVLRGACVMLRATPSGVMPAVSVTISLDATPEEARAIYLASRRLARQYGFQETITLDRTSLTVRFSRLAAEQGRRTPEPSFSRE